MSVLVDFRVVIQGKQFFFTYDELHELKQELDKLFPKECIGTPLAPYYPPGIRTPEIEPYKVTCGTSVKQFEKDSI